MELEGHPDGEYWLHRGLAAREAENLRDKPKKKPKMGQRGA